MVYYYLIFIVVIASPCVSSGIAREREREIEREIVIMCSKYSCKQKPNFLKKYNIIYIKRRYL